MHLIIEGFSLPLETVFSSRSFILSLTNGFNFILQHKDTMCIVKRGYMNSIFALVIIKIFRAVDQSKNWLFMNLSTSLAIVPILLQKI